MPSNPDDIQGIPVYPSEFVAWRGWVVGADGLLRSVNHGEVWTPGEEMEAVCQLGRSHESPRTSCQCGIYTTKTLKKLRMNGYHKHGVFGLVSIWGRIVDGGEGYRSQFAYPRVIFVPYLSWRLVDMLKVYEVPVTTANPYTSNPEVEEWT